MASISLNLPADYWTNFQPGKKDLEYLNTHLFETETPLTEKELVSVLVEERIHHERESLLRQQQADSKVYLPKEHFKAGDKLTFPALGWKKGKVTDVRPGVNTSLPPFEVIEVEFEDGCSRLFSTGIADHKLNQPVEFAADDQLFNSAYVLQNYGAELEQKLTQALDKDHDLTQIAGRWFARALLVDIGTGYLNLAEAVLEEAGGKPLPTATLIEQVGLAVEANPKLVGFSMDFALQQDGRFDDVGPAGEVLWCLKRLEPKDVQQIPAPLQYIEIPYDRSILTPTMRALEVELDDELSEIESPFVQAEVVTVSLTYPHWRAGTLPVSARLRGLFPTAYESPRVRFTFMDGQSHEEIPAWLVRQHSYVAGLGPFYHKYAMMPGSLITLTKGKKPAQIILMAHIRRPTRDWVRTVLAGSDGGIVFATLKQNLATEFNERMVLAVPDVAGLDEACAQLAKARPPFEQVTADMMRELTKLNVQAHVHAQELYSALNVVRRCPPGPILALLTSDSHYKHVGDLHYRLVEMEDDRE